MDPRSLDTWAYGTRFTRRRRSGRFSLVATFTAFALVLGSAAAYASVSTDQADYAPGSVVTISGDNNNGAGYLAGETVVVDVSGPNGYTASCEGIADDNGAWSCQVTLWDSELAIGDYTYTATGQTSGVSESGTFTDGSAGTSVSPTAVNVTEGGAAALLSITTTITGAVGTGSSFTVNTVYTISPAGVCTGSIPSSSQSVAAQGGAGTQTFITSASVSAAAGASGTATCTINEVIVAVTSGAALAAGGAATLTVNVFNLESYTSGCTTPSDSFTTGSTVCAKAFALPTTFRGSIKWFGPGSITADNTTSFTSDLTANTASGTFAPTTCGTWTTKLFDDAATPNLLDTDTFEVTGCVTNTPPSVSVSGVTHGTSYEIGSVPTATCDATDIEDGNSSFAATLSAITGPLSGIGLGSQTASCSYTDGGGLTATASATYSIVDTGAASNVSIDIDSGAAWTNSTGVSLHIHGEDAVGVTGYYVANGDTTTCLAAAFASYTAVTSTMSYNDPALAHTLAIGEGTKTVCVVFRDASGNKTAAEDTIGLDTIAPTITDDGVSAGTTGNAGWYISAVTNGFSANDGGSGLSATCDADFPKSVSTGTSEGSAVTVASGACSDVAGNTNTGILSAAFMIDLTSPTITDDGVSAGTTGNAGWYISAVTNGFSANDGGSGLSATCDADFPKSVSTGTSEGSAVTVASGACSDVAGNTNTGILSAAFMIDLTAPSVAFTSCPAIVVLGSSGTVAWSASDVTSGLVGASGGFVALDTSGPGPNTVTKTVFDVAGNSATASCAYSIGHVTFDAPIEGPSVINNAKQGRVIPVKARVTVDGQAVTTGYVSILVNGLTTCPSGTQDALETYASPGSSFVGNQFTYDPVAGRWRYNLDTSAYGMVAPKCYVGNVYVNGAADGNGKVTGGSLVGYFLINLSK